MRLSPALGRALAGARYAGSRNALFGIVQGGMYEDLRDESLGRARSASASTATPSAACRWASPRRTCERILAHTAPRLPADQPRYLMGVGTPEDLVEAVLAGIDMFDCVLPTRNARNGWLFTRHGDVKITQRALPRRPAAARRATAAAMPAAISRRAYLHHLQPRQRDPRRAPEHDPQPALLPGADARAARRPSSGGAARRSDRRAAAWKTRQPAAIIRALSMRESAVIICQRLRTGRPPPAAMSGFMGLLPIVLMFVLLYFLMIRPQMKRAKEHKPMIEALQKGDEVRHRRRHRRPDHQGGRGLRQPGDRARHRDRACREPRCRPCCPRAR